MEAVAVGPDGLGWRRPVVVRDPPMQGGVPGVPWLVNFLPLVRMKHLGQYGRGAGVDMYDPWVEGGSVKVALRAVVNLSRLLVRRTGFVRRVPSSWLSIRSFKAW